MRGETETDQERERERERERYIYITIKIVTRRLRKTKPCREIGKEKEQENE